MSVRAVPVGVYMTKHEAVPVAVPATNVQGEVANVPVPLVVKPTVPVGLVGVALVSVTVAVHVDADPMSTDAGRHVMAVVVRLPVPVTVADPALVAWVESPP